MRKDLPKGYYFVGTEELENGKEIIVSFAGVEYVAVFGENYFADISSAENVATLVPETVIQGLKARYERFNAPVLLIGAGLHNHKVVELHNNIYIIGDEGAKLVGLFWFGFFFVRGEWAVIENLALENIRIEDHRDGAGEYTLTCKNLIYSGGNPWWSYYCPAKGKESVKHYYFENITLDNVDGFGYGFDFFCIAPTTLSVKNLRVFNSNKSLGFCYGQPSVAEGSDSLFVFENCVFENNKWGQGIELDFSKAGGQVRIENCVFDNVLHDCDSLFRVELSNKTQLIIQNCRFHDAKKRFIVANQSMDGIMLSGCDVLAMTTESGSIVFDANTEKRLIVQDCLENISDVHEKAIENFSILEKLYANRQPFYCDMHVHSNSGGTSDGQVKIADWPKEMVEKKIDFISIADHRQMRHFFLPEFDETKFFYANEPEAILEGDYSCPRLHYNMIFPDKFGLGKMLNAFHDKYEFQGDALTGSFVYKNFTHEELEAVAKFVTDNGGIFAHAHPKSMLTSENPLDYYFGEKTYIECFTSDYTRYWAQKNCRLWADLLQLGKRVYNLSGSDSHGHCQNSCVSTVYAEKRHNTSLFPYFRAGDFSSGGFGIKMVLGTTPMGGVASYMENSDLLIEIGDLFEIYKDKQFLVKVISDQGVAYATMFDGKETLRIALKAKQRKFYRVEILDLDTLCVFGLSNPIWLE